MYQFDEESWDECPEDDAACFDQRPWKSVDGGFLIQRLDRGKDEQFCATGPFFLQIGTGQWCDARFATVFPKRSTAEFYAWEFGRIVGRDACVIHRRF
ncbi:hypothetical protein Poly51_24930 [Rubripirellula tenax]|uniref:Uncharacterized protein n=1 Tax=Rubripirellula tenax TaxID=2528015 RepID=A0A5C6F854_9BACT|nr:hypothetical protein [Rubripirellula tenax]TWU56577.1 hypothetical protein Poly51_24930 [Rubripirellula tenax]